VKCIDWSFNGYLAPADGAFDAFLANGTAQLLLTALFSCFTIGIILLGVGKGIERFTRVLMPILFGIIIYLLITAFTMPGAGQALNFLFRPSFKQLPMAGVLEALGHAFFTLSLGMGVMITYGSYLSGKESVPRVAGTVVLFDTLIALFACMIMYTIIFSSQGLEAQISKSTVGMLFVTLPSLFYTEMSAGSVVGPLFYILVAFAALTSTISLLEVMVAYFIDRRGWKRTRATLLCGGCTYVVSIFCALSLGAFGGLSSLKILPGAAGVFGQLDYLAANWLLPVGGLLTTLFVGWFVAKRISLEQLRLHDEHGEPAIYFHLWRFFIRFIAPAAILAVIIAVIMGKDFS
jgi:NSS family neurotransmitter:Na+ symporter